MVDAIFDKTQFLFLISLTLPTHSRNTYIPLQLSFSLWPLVTNNNDSHETLPNAPSFTWTSWPFSPTLPLDDPPSGPPSPPTIPLGHPMNTHLKGGAISWQTLKCQHTYALTSIAHPSKEASRFTKANSSLEWCKAMTKEYTALVRNQT